MSDQQSINAVRETFESSFDRTRFIRFIRNLLNEYEAAEISRTGNYIPDAYSNYVSKYERIGKYADSDDKRIDILIVHLKKETSIERARSMQRNFVAGYLKGNYGTDSYKDAALVAFVSPNREDWRFSLVKLEVRLDAQADGQVKLVDAFTPARRWSFLVGNHEKSHTAQRQFQPILADLEHNPTLEKLEEAFNIEKVTNEFFREYRRLFIETKGALDKAVKANPKTKADFASKGIDTTNLAKKLLGQIIFLYYLQKKGWFGVPKDGKWGQGSKNFLRELFDKKDAYTDFFNDVLEPLFYEALRIDRRAEDYYYKRFNCRISFLNGGLFDPLGNYDWEKTIINLSNTLFSHKTKDNPEGDGILDVFDLYNFTVNEDEPFEKEVAIDPELLGKAYEKFNAIRPDNYDEFLKALKSGKKGDESKFNKQYGVFYTPREIVHYMCQQSLINYLATELEGKVGRDDLAALVLQGENLLEHEARAESNPTKKYQPILSESIRKYAALIDEKLANIKVCDPAVGSGAFLVGMMSEIVRAREVLAVYKQTSEVSKTSEVSPTGTMLTTYDFKRHCIEHSLYGVDIDAGAVEIAKLRLWLSLVVDEDDPQNIKPLPNLDYKVVQGNSLIGVEKNLFNVYLFKELETLKPLFFNATNSAKKQEYKTKIDGLIDQITDGRAQFDFEIYFSEVFHEKGGFDIVIGNPPYVGHKGGQKEFFRKMKETSLGRRFNNERMDLFYYFFHKSIDIGSNNSTLVFITTNYYPTADSAGKLRTDFKNRTSVIKLVNLGEVTVFESATGQHNLITMLAKQQADIVCEIVSTNRIGTITSDELRSILNKTDEQTKYSYVKQSSLYEGTHNYIRIADSSKAEDSGSIIKILQKMQVNFRDLGLLCHVSQGIVTGVDKISKKHLEKYPKLNLINGEGVYVLDSATAKKLDDKEIVKPWFKNSDVGKFTTSVRNTKWVIQVTTDTDLPKHKNVYKYLSKFESIIKSRNYESGELSKAKNLGKWWALSSARKEFDFTAPKIVAPQRSYANTFGYNEIPWYASADVYFITQKDASVSLKYLLALLNSKLYYLWLYHRGKRKGEMLELYQKPLSEIPIKKISDDEQKPFIKLVERILTAKRGDPQADTSAWEREIDQLVYGLYGLTEDEVKIVEGEV